MSTLELINEASIISLLPLVADKPWMIRYVLGNPWINHYEEDEKGFNRSSVVCPVVALVRELSDGKDGLHGLGAATAMSAFLGRRLQASEVDAVVNVMNAADGREGHSPALRASIMRHLGMIE